MRGRNVRNEGDGGGWQAGEQETVVAKTKFGLDRVEEAVRSLQ